MPGTAAVEAVAGKGAGIAVEAAEWAGAAGTIAAGGATATAEQLAGVGTAPEWGAAAGQLILGECTAPAEEAWGEAGMGAAALLQGEADRTGAELQAGAAW